MIYKLSNRVNNYEVFDFLKKTERILISMVQGKLLSYGDNLQEVYEIRRKVFVEGIGLSETEEFDDMDSQAIHVLVYEQVIDETVICNPNVASRNIAVATGRIVYNGTSCKLERIAVLKQFRRKGYGDFTVRMLINRAFTAGIDEVWVDTLPDTVEFFRRIGFHTVNKMENTDIKMLIRMSDRKTCCNNK